MPIIDEGVPAVHSAAEHVHRPVDTGDEVVCEHCLTEWPCRKYRRYIMILNDERISNDTNKSTKESTGGKTQGSVLRGK